MPELDATLIAKLRELPPQRQAEVEDFIDFLHERDDARRLTRPAAAAAAPAFAKVWENDEDAVYDAL
jgi:hypothetical protein